MTDAAAARRKADYGFDAGFALPLAGITCLAMVAVAAVSGSIPQAVAGCTALGFVGFGLHTSRRGKFLVWQELLDGLELKGDERVLDLGCGRGAVLLSAARRLTTGRGVGVDIWSRSDQSGNSAGALRRNAEAEGVPERVAPLTADMTALPFPPDVFDVVVSNVAIHNIRGQRGRDAALDEAVRVLRPGGRLLVADLAFTRAYERRLAERGMAGTGRRSLGWRMWWSGPWRATYLVTASKPARASHGPTRSVGSDHEDSDQADP
jgi:ubiquinone/menaquinone biosynthesis C-methylase UbiE